MRKFLDRQPVIIGVGESIDRGRSLAEAKEPMALMVEALQAAQQDAGTALLQHVDTLYVVREFSWPYVDPPGLLAWRLDMPASHRFYGEDGGETPIRCLHEAAQRIASGASGVVAVVGAEAAYTTAAAWKSNVPLPWQHRDSTAKTPTGRDFVSETALVCGVVQPAHVYPFFENAFAAARGKTQAEALVESAEMYSRLSAIAARQPFAWSQRTYRPEEMLNTDADNRWVAWPYCKRMVANPMVNQGAAILLTNRARAREMGVADDRMIHVWGGAYAREHRDYLQRDSYSRSAAQTAVLQSVAERVGGAQAFQALEIYSCFPCVPKMALHALGLPDDTSVSVTGGLSFFGGPLNNYMSHAAVAMTRVLREADERPALLYGQGEYLTKHHALVLSRCPDEGAFDDMNPCVQARADLMMSVVPELLHWYEGEATVETFTVLYDRQMQPDFGAVIARTPIGERLLARVPAGDRDTINWLTAPGRSPIGSHGRVQKLDEHRLRWVAA
ncbi:acetyl-CoA acetyltransferase [Sinimarinibacterium thermocellulolyticum]|uniref:Acetyl-CoA acetyltransferase n=1 Tax=Sinimarinibacterium thermocellulolyticum TaxID=3170016 RepID=A0ABV2ADP7_9GAMM